MLSRSNLVFLAVLSVLFPTLSSCGKKTTEYVIGQPGPKGDKGDTGPQGPAGIDGVSCTVSPVSRSEEAPNGGSLITCANGITLILNGANGQDGEDGRDGTPGTAISAVRLCPGDTVYPSTFIEVAFKFDGKLWAVYSTHGGFMTQLPPGRYSSNGVNSRCDFTVNNDLTISNND